LAVHPTDCNSGGFLHSSLSRGIPVHFFSSLFFHCLNYGHARSGSVCDNEIEGLTASPR
jgi:hypothetical protein